MEIKYFDRRRIILKGVIQGIGFRPFVYRLAKALSLTGSVCNDGQGVSIEVQGRAADLNAFNRRLETDLPPSGRIDKHSFESIEPVKNEQTFIIAKSIQTDKTSLSLAPDRSVCADCQAEMRDSGDRRYRYPFINCTACGPRYTIAINLPYDRPNTTMASFNMCKACKEEYVDPLDRRYHAQPLACPECGPHVWLLKSDLSSGKSEAVSGEPIADAIRRLKAGQVVAIKGIGGFHLAVDGRNQRAVQHLRKLKRRSRKPLAVMVRDIETARCVVHLDEKAEQLLLSPASPIVLALSLETSPLAKEIAPGLTDLGVMLPYSPLHRLLFDDTLDALVMTSGNHASEPITTDNQEAVSMLPAKAFLLHDRDIHVANDDSVIRTTAQGPVFMRRSRGYVPEPINASHLPDRSVLALGGELKVTVTTLSNREMVVGRHLGNLDNTRSEAVFRKEVERMLTFGRVQPEAVAVDLHPDFFSTLYAEEMFKELPLIRIQHHHAHLAAVLAEHGLGPETRALGIILDGLGYGTDKTIWGGEVLFGGYREFERAGHLRPIPQPGGDRAAVEPFRMATSLLVDADLKRSAIPGYDAQIERICHLPNVSPLTSSTGRLFDGVAAILDVAPKMQDYEGEAAARLESVADSRCDDAYPFCLDHNELDTRALTTALIEDSAPVPIRAARFHNSLADGLVALTQNKDSDLVVLSGGCMINRLLLNRLVSNLQSQGRSVLIPTRLPPGDGGLSAGQAAAAACMLEES